MASKQMRSFPLAYHISLHTYGSWIPGDSRRWHSRGDGARSFGRPGNEALMGIVRGHQRDPTIVLTGPMIRVIVTSIAGLADTRGWKLYAVEAVASHLHTVIGAALPAVGVLDEIRGETARCLAAEGLRDDDARFWSEGGHFSMIHTVSQLERAVEYTNRHRWPGRE